MKAIPHQINPQSARSVPDNPSKDSLNSEIARLKNSADWWNNGYLVFGFLVVVVAGVAAYFQYTAVGKARQLAEKEAALSRVKESELNQDLKDKEVQIGQLGKDAELIKAAAATAQQQSAEKIAILTAEADKARADIAAAKLATADALHATEELRKANIEAGEKLEAEKRERLALEEFLSPRTLGEQGSFNRAVNARGDFRNITALLVVVQDGEARRLASQLGFTLSGFVGPEFVQWKVIPDAVTGNLFDGVAVEYNILYWQREGDLSQSAAKALSDVLKERKIDARPVGTGTELPPNFIRIKIGLKPTREGSEMLRETDQILEDFDRRFKERQEEIRDAIRKGPPPSFTPLIPPTKKEPESPKKKE